MTVYELHIKTKDKSEINQAIKSIEYIMALHDLADYLRSEDKYGTGSKPVQEKIDEIRSKFYEILNDRNINLDVEFS